MTTIPALSKKQGIGALGKAVTKHKNFPCIPFVLTFNYHPRVSDFLL